MISLSTAMTETGAAKQLADGLLSVVDGGYALLLGLFLLTAVLGQLISNMATALIVIPVALSAAQELDVSAKPVLMAVTVSAAASFLTPVATPANLMVMSPGGYRFGDYWKLGLPLLLLFAVVAVALFFDFTNGFHDTANAIATSVSTRAMSPRFAVALSAVLNFAGAFISLEVAATVAGGIVDADVITPTVVFGGLVGAIAWNLITWYFGLPSSSSHALIGGMVGAVLVADGASAISFDDGILGKVMIPAVVAPLLAFVVAGGAILLLYRIVGRLHPGPVTGGFRLGQVISGGLLALAHGTNDAQKTMGVITLALVANGTIAQDDFYVPSWVV
ncbi:MAG: SLC13 family permease, partial [Thermoleophilia bacterium]